MMDSSQRSMLMGDDPDSNFEEDKDDKETSPKRSRDH